MLAAPENNLDPEVMNSLPDHVDLTGKKIRLAGPEDMEFQADSYEQEYRLRNPEDNNGICFIKFSLYIDQNENKAIDASDELLYQSGLVPPGYAISRIRLTRTLRAGSYKVIWECQPYSYDKEQRALNTGVFQKTMVVK